MHPAALAINVLFTAAAAFVTASSIHRAYNNHKLRKDLSDHMDRDMSKLTEQKDSSESK